MSIDRSVIEKRITELEKERDAFVQQANAQIASYHGAIAALKALLALNEQAETDDKRTVTGRSMTFDDILTLQGPLAGLAALTWVIVEAVEQWQPTLEKRWLPVIAFVVAEALAHGVALTFDLYPLSAAWFVGIVCALGAVGGNSGVRAVAGR